MQDFFRLIQVYWLHTVVRCRCMMRFSNFWVETPSCNKFYAIKIKITNFYFCFKTFLGKCINALATLKWCFDNCTTLLPILDHHDFGIFQMIQITTDALASYSTDAGAWCDSRMFGLIQHLATKSMQSRLKFQNVIFILKHT